jgi:arabinan endo-1,5-alpha-L-arabinosidase
MEELNTFQNPVLNENVGDPTVWKDNDTFYLFYTGNFNSTIYNSKDMLNWTDMKICPFTNDTIEQLKSIANTYNSDPVIYAPTVIKNGDNWLMYLSITWKCMVVLKATSPIGPFKFANGLPYILVDEEISGLPITFEDSCVAYDHNEKQWYLMFGSHGNLTRTTLQNNGLYLTNNAKFDHVAGIPKCNPRKIYEGLYAYYKDNWWYLFAASGDYTSATNPYRVVVGRSKKLSGTFKNKWGLPMKWGFANTILNPDSTDIYLGGGHTGEIFEDNEGNTYIYYQRQRANEKHFRPLFLQRIYWDKKGWPYFKNNETQITEIKPKIK